MIRDANPHRGAVPLDIGTRRVELRLTWDALARLDAAGAAAEIDLTDLGTLARVIAIASGGAVTEQEIRIASPPVMPTIEAVRDAFTYAYWGAEPPPDDEDEDRGEGEAETKKKIGRSPRSSLLRFVSAWRRKPSGA